MQSQSSGNGQVADGQIAKGQIVYDPRGIITVEPAPLAKRIAAIDGLRLGVLDNTKWNAAKLLRRATARLEQRYQFAAVNYYAKESFSKAAPAELTARIAAENDLAITAIGD